jgi:hypothetical protein
MPKILSKGKEEMKEKSLTHSFTVDRSPMEAYNAINNVRRWWSGEIEGDTEKLGDVWIYRYKDFHMTKHKITKLAPGKKVVWLVLDSYLSFVEDKTEWNGTKIIFDISRKNGKTEVVFTHQGLHPRHQCFTDCNDAWGSYIKGSLKNLIIKGKGQPNPKEKKNKSRANGKNEK